MLIQLRADQHNATRDKIRKFSGAGRVPVLKIEEGGQDRDGVGQSGDLRDHRRAPSRSRICGRMTGAARAVARSYAAEMHSGFPDLRDQLSMDFARTLPLPELRPQTKEQIERILSSWEAALAEYGGDGGFLFGRFSIADCMYAPVVSRFTTFGVEVSQPVKDYMARIWALPAMQAWLRRRRRKSRTASPRSIGQQKCEAVEERGAAFASGCATKISAAPRGGFGIETRGARMKRRGRHQGGGGKADLARGRMAGAARRRDWPD